MNTKTIEFNHGKILISDKTISFVSRYNQSTQTMDRSLIGGINKQEYSYLPRQVMQYGFRFGLGGLFLTILGVGISFWVDINFVIWIGFASTVFGFFLVFGDLIESLFGTKITYNICNNLFGRNGYTVTIQNNSGGNHIEFLADLSELSQANDLIKYRKEDVTKSILRLDELTQLLELKNTGILTEEEYKFKKNQLLNN